LVQATWKLHQTSYTDLWKRK